MAILNNVKVSPIKDKTGTLEYSDGFGYREFYLDGKLYTGFHTGIDITTLGTIQAVARGKVVEVRDGVPGYDEALGLGNYVMLYHGNCTYTVYGHMDNGSISVKLGDIVEAGTKLGTDIVATSGFSTGLHLHFTIKVENVYVDPIPYLQGVKEIPNYGGDTPTPGDIIYIVKYGDTLSEIAEMYGLTYQELAAYNNISNPDLIFPGQVIRIPNGETPVPVITYTVEPGDSLWSIAEKFNTTWQAIYEKNKNIIGDNPNLIYPGQVLVI